MNPDSHRRDPLPRATGWEWAQATLLSVNLGWTILCLGGYRAETMVITLLLTCLLAAVHFVERAIAPVSQGDGSAGGGPMDRLLITHSGSIWVWGFIAYAAANVMWVSPVPWLGWFDWAKWLQMAVVFWVVVNGLRSPGPRQLVFAAVAALAVAGVGLACYQRFVDPSWLMLGRIQADQFLQRSSGPFGAPNSFAGLLILIVPATAALSFRRGAGAVERVAWGWVTAVLVFGLILTISRGAWIALALALIAWPLLISGWAWRRRLAISAGVGVMVLAVGSVVYIAVPKARERFEVMIRDTGERSRPILWRAGWELVRTSPVWGTGAGSYDALFERHRPEGFVDRPEWAHNDYLNTLSDYGSVGVLLLGGGLGMIVRGRRSNAGPWRRNNSWIDDVVFRRGLGIGVLAFGLQLWVDFHLKIPALGIAFAATSGLALGRSSGIALKPGGRQSQVLLWLGVAGSLSVAVWLVPLYRAEGLRASARETLDRIAFGSTAVEGVRLRGVEEQLQRAVRLAPDNGRAWSDLAFATILLASAAEAERRSEFGRSAEVAADRALRCSEAVFEFWIWRGVARDLQGRWLEAGDDFVHALTLAPASLTAWYYYADHLSRIPTQQALAAGVVAFCLRLDPTHRPTIVLRQRLAIGARAP